MESAPPDVEVSERRPGLLVTMCGIVVSTATLYFVHLLNNVDFNPMGFYLWGFIPFGAMLVGACSGLGYAYASRFLQIKLEKRYAWAMLVTGLMTYWAALFITYTAAIEAAGVDSDQYGFVDYLRDSCEQMVFKGKDGKEGKPLGGFGYALKLLEMIGFAGGVMFPALAVSGLPYCRRCQKYLKPFAKGHRNSLQLWSDIRSLSKAERTTAIEACIQGFGPQTEAEIELLATGSPADLKAFIDKLDPKPMKTAVARLVYEIQKCPTCDAHRVKVTLENCAVDGSPNTNILQTIDKFEPTDDEIDSPQLGASR